MKCLIASNKKFELWKLKRMVKKIMGKKIELFFSDKESETLKIIKNAMVKDGDYIEIAIIDADLSHDRGFCAAQEIRRISPGTQIIYIADSDRDAVFAWRIHISCFLIRPVKQSDLKDALDHLWRF